MEATTPAFADEMFLLWGWAMGSEGGKGGVGPTAIGGREPAKGLEPVVEGVIPGAGKRLVGDSVGEGLPRVVMGHEREVHSMSLKHVLQGSGAQPLAWEDLPVNVVELRLMVFGGLAKKPAPACLGDDPCPPEDAVRPAGQVGSLEPIGSLDCVVVAGLGRGALARGLSVVYAENASLPDNMSLVLRVRG